MTETGVIQTDHTLRFTVASDKRCDVCAASRSMELRQCHNVLSERERDFADRTTFSAPIGLLRQTKVREKEFWHAKEFYFSSERLLSCERVFLFPSVCCVRQKSERKSFVMRKSFALPESSDGSLSNSSFDRI